MKCPQCNEYHNEYIESAPLDFKNKMQKTKDGYLVEGEKFYCCSRCNQVLIFATGAKLHQTPDNAPSELLLLAANLFSMKGNRVSHYQATTDAERILIDDLRKTEAGISPTSPYTYESEEKYKTSFFSKFYSFIVSFFKSR